MKLCILCTMLNEFGRKGYYNSQEIGLGRALAARGHSTVIYKCVPRGEAAESRELQPGLTIRYLPIPGVGAHGYLRTGYLDAALDGILCFADNQLFLPHVARWCRENHVRFVPYVGTAHGLWEDFRSRVSDWLFSGGTLKIYKNDPVLAKTEAARQELLSLGVPPSNITITPVGLDTSVLKRDFLQYDRGGLKRKYGFAPDDVVICTVARLQPEKRPLDMVDIFLRVKDKKKFRLLIVGQGPLRPALDGKIAENHLEALVKIIDRVHYEDMWEIYRLSDYFLNLNRGEIFGMAVMEAVYYQTSVAASDALGPRLTLKDMPGHKLCRDDGEIEAWLTADYPDPAALAESAGKLAAAFTWDVCAGAFEAIVRGT